MPKRFKGFGEMAQSLRAGAASGMNTQITLEPDSAVSLAEILEAYEAVLGVELSQAAAAALSEFFAKGGRSMDQLKRDLKI